eukprot:CAMPEP_0171090788 /NCGR_PEP_ID=MMETSP0766_2-20121228/32063_1 /TAXON_ID=439317 /ORGANISM="Gambierdiscus australes, Strain CAWD 149" /LENGTH=35 /DNA_ID= /DNA_START= /DNA_END= /DNA_ORIENTATION=
MSSGAADLHIPEEPVSTIALLSSVSASSALSMTKS